MYSPYVIDSNILIGFLNGNQKIAKWILDKKASGASLYISYISIIEVLSLKELKEKDIENLEKFLNSFLQIPISDEIVRFSATLRRKNILALGDAIIAGTVISKKGILVTNDKTLAKKASQFVEVISI